jgi:hypothetical protein
MCFALARFYVVIGRCDRLDGLILLFVLRLCDAARLVSLGAWSLPVGIWVAGDRSCRSRLRILEGIRLPRPRGIDQLARSWRSLSRAAEPDGVHGHGGNTGGVAVPAEGRPEAGLRAGLEVVEKLLTNISCSGTARRFGVRRGLRARRARGSRVGRLELWPAYSGSVWWRLRWAPARVDLRSAMARRPYLL